MSLPSYQQASSMSDREAQGRHRVRCVVFVSFGCLDLRRFLQSGCSNNLHRIPDSGPEERNSVTHSTRSKASSIPFAKTTAVQSRLARASFRSIPTCPGCRVRTRRYEQDFSLHGSRHSRRYSPSGHWGVHHDEHLRTVANHWRPLSGRRQWTHQSNRLLHTFRRRRDLNHFKHDAATYIQHVAFGREFLKLHTSHQLSTALTIIFQLHLHILSTLSARRENPEAPPRLLPKNCSLKLNRAPLFPALATAAPHTKTIQCRGSHKAGRVPPSPHAAPSAW